MYFLLGVSLTLAFLLIVNLTVAIFASSIWRVVSPLIEGRSVETRAKIIFGLRVIPVIAALVFVLGFIVPAYALLEPENSGEVVSTKLGAIAILCLIGITMAIFRVIRTWLATRRLMKNWVRNAVEISLAEVDLPILRIKHEFPVLAVVGILRPRIFVAEKVLATLREEELAAAIAHEYGHLHARDNLKRTVLRICRDLVIFPIGGGLDLAWAQNAEVVADEHAASTDNSRALDLASALVKISRMVPDGSTPSLPVGAYIITDRDGDVSSRIRRLLKLSERKVEAGANASRSYSVLTLGWSFVLMSVLALHLVDNRLLFTTHEAIEHFVWMIR